VNRIHAILGASDQCIATHPSDMCVALAVLEPIVHVVGAKEKGPFHLSITIGCPATSLPGITNDGDNLLD
jgi:CO/xanthine dehydrogenase FAD-binding subunit